MKTLLAVPALLVALGALAACGSEGDATATDPAGERPTAVPAAPGSVTTRGIVTVMDTGTPELCLGPVAESWPPQCGGPAIEGWDWDEHRDMFESQGDTRWGQFVVTGGWDGTTLTFEGAIPAALYDTLAEEPSTPPEPSVDLDPAELDRIAEEVGELPGALGSYAQQRRVLLDVTFDDGSLQAWVDQEYGEDVVIVTSMLVPTSSS